MKKPKKTVKKEEKKITLGTEISHIMENFEKLNSISRTDALKKIKVEKQKSTEPSTTSTESLQIKKLPEFIEKKLNCWKIAKYIREKERAREKLIAKKHETYFELCNPNLAFLETDLIKKYPLFGADKIQKYKHIYDEPSCQLLNQSMFKIKDEYKDSPELLDLLKPPSLSNILFLSETPEQRLPLNRWKVKKIEELGYSGFEEFSKQLKNRGTVFHKALEKCIGGEPYDKVTIGKEHEKAWASLKDVLTDDVQKTLLFECSIKHPNLCYAGVFDSICYFKDTVYVLEWKLGEKRKDDLYDYPIQLAAYLGAFLSDSRYAELRSHHDVKNVMVIRALVDGSPPSVHCLSFHQTMFYWTKWLERLQRFWNRVREINKEMKI